jgi:predicted Zn-dependent protease
VIWLLALLAVPVLLGGCRTVDGTGRSQLNFMSASDELNLGREAYQEQIGQAKKITSGPTYEMVSRVCTSIAGSASRMYPEATSGFEWEFTLIDDDGTLNAWCLPGGKIAVYTGILKVADTEDRLAAVVGHEAAHAVARHGGERMSQQMATQLILQGAGAGLSFSTMSPAMQQGTMAALGLGTEVGVLLPFSRSQESEADELGVYIAADAGYDPREAIQLWKNMAAVGGEKPPEWMSTHPADSTRIARLEEVMPKAMQIYQARTGTPASGQP